MASMLLSDHNMSISVISYNMHGYNQGIPTVTELINDLSPDVFLLQEHWLTPDNLNKFDTLNDYFSFGTSAMTSTVSSGILTGRPFGGVICLINNRLRNCTKTVHSSDRYCIVIICNLVIVNVYLPCAGTPDRNLICSNVLHEIESWLQDYSDFNVLFAGDFNVDLDSVSDISSQINSFSSSHTLTRCDLLFNCKNNTYINPALNSQSTIDYILISDKSTVTHFEILDPDINFSDHVPLLCTANIMNNTSRPTSSSNNTSTYSSVKQLRWDRGDINSYYYFTGQYLQPIISELDQLTTLLKSNLRPPSMTENYIDDIYNRTVTILLSASNNFIPQYNKNFFKHWWDEELNLLKQDSIDSNQLWKAAGKPRNGPIFARRQSCRAAYRSRLRQNEKSALQSYTNELHDALLKKDGATFWKCWSSKFSCHNDCKEVDGTVDHNLILTKFISYFSSCYTANNVDRAQALKNEYAAKREKYFTAPLSDDCMFNVEHVSTCISHLKRGKAAGLDNLTSEHLMHAHPSLSSVLYRLFNLMLLSGHVPPSFGYSYTVPIPKIADTRIKSMSCSDFRGISISCIISKVFEHCILSQFSEYFKTKENQFGFKKLLGCNHAILALKNIVSGLLKCGSTVNLCSLDLSKAFDKVNHHALFLKLMKRNIPSQLLVVIENWLTNCFSCIKWHNFMSKFFQISFGVRQGSVLSPILFSVYCDDIVNFENRYAIILYADDILIITHSVTTLQHLFYSCERELQNLDLSINMSKTHCLRIGPRYDSLCSNIVNSSGVAISWVQKNKIFGYCFNLFRQFQMLD